MDKIEKFISQLLEALGGSASRTEMLTSTVFVALGVSTLLAGYIYLIYRVSTRTGFYSKSFNKTLALMSLVTTGIVLSMQTSVFVSLGMVGALSIVRFRNVVKEPLDLFFLFWSISVGIICGTGLYKIALLLSLVVTVALMLLDLVQTPRAPYLLIINAANISVATALDAVLKRYTKRYRIKSRTVSSRGVNLIIELHTKQENALVGDCSALEGVSSVSLMAHDGELRA